MFGLSIDYARLAFRRRRGFPRREVKSSRLVFLAVVFGVPAGRAAIQPATIDVGQVRDVTSLEIAVLQDWKLAPREPAVRQKVIEITVGEWWPGQRIRVPVTLNRPATGGTCRQVLVANMGLGSRAALPSGAMLQLLKEDGVGVVLVGMGPIEAMPPVGRLHVGMKEHLLAQEDARFTPAWIWGMSYMRALTAAMTDGARFLPTKVIATGGSKCGIAAMVATIHDDRFTAAMPVVTPIANNPGGPFVIGTESDELVRMNAEFLSALAAGQRADLPASCYAALEERRERQANERITLAQAQTAGWAEAEILAMNDCAWDLARVASHNMALQRRGVDLFFNVGTNDNVSPNLLEAFRRVPSLPLYIVPGGQHGGSTTTGFTRQVHRLPEVDANLVAFARKHFFGKGISPAPPAVRTSWDLRTRRLSVSVRVDAAKSSTENELWWALDRHPPGTLPYEYDKWQSIALQPAEPGNFTAEVVVPPGAAALQCVTTHTYVGDGLALTISSPVTDLDVK